MMDTGVWTLFSNAYNVQAAEQNAGNYIDQQLLRTKDNLYMLSFHYVQGSLPHNILVKMNSLRYQP